MNSLIVLSALLGLAVAVPPAAVSYAAYDAPVIASHGYGLAGNGYGLVGNSIGLVGNGYGLAGHGYAAAPVAVGHGIATSYATRVAHPAVVHSAPAVYSHGYASAPIVRSVAHAPAILGARAYTTSYGHGIAAAPAVLATGHGYGLAGHGLAAPALLAGKVY